MIMIETADLQRSFNGRVAVDGITFAVERGEVLGFLGPNGAGKTTTIRMLTGQLRPSGGSARVAGFDCERETRKLKPCIGVVSEHQNLYERMTGRENLAFFAELFGIARQRVDEVLELVDLADRARDKTKIYSNGMKQRLIIARALLNCPQVLFLDEPTRGLDPVAALEIRQIVTDLSRSGTTIFLTTHYMEEADQLCRRVAFLNEGRIVALDTPRNLKLAHGQRQVRVLLNQHEDQEPREVVLSLDRPTDARCLGEYLLQRQVITMHSEEATLEDVFVKLAARKLT